MTTIPEYANLTALPDIWAIAAKKFPDILALHDPHSKPEVKLTFAQLYQQIKQFASGLQALGVTPDDKISLIADNSPRWFIADQGSMLAGAANAVRSAQADKNELAYILRDSDSSTLIVENQKTLDKLRSFCDEIPLQLIILLSDETPKTDDSIKTLNYSQLMEQGANNTLQPITKEDDDLATLIYTSGTTGQPKGAMLSHGNLLHQVKNLDAIIQPKAGDIVLSILPSWHSYERSAEYFLLSQGCTLTYTNIRNFKTDLKKFKPHHMVGVPRLWDSLYEGIQKQLRDQSPTQQKIVQFFFNLSQTFILSRRIANNMSLEHFDASGTERFIARLKASLLAPLHSLGDKLVYNKIREGLGGNFETLVSGGGSLAKHLDDFYEIINVPVLVGYGLTETSPVTNARTHSHNLRGSSGQPIPKTEIKIVDLDTGEPLSQGKKGVVLIRGPQVMQGYYKKPEATAKAINSEGWFNSGDLGWITPMNDLVITGRAKDTIVLSNGENIEPQPIEDACVRSAYIDQMMLVGQDQKALGALIVPNLDALQTWGKNQQLNLTFPPEDASREAIVNSDLYGKPVQDLFKQELNREVKNRPGYRADDQIKAFELILEPFSVENGMMTQTLKIKRPVVTERYQGMIDGMFES
ncbi:probable long-chain-fatty-acid CoA ligase [Crocosphaera subtropica ATCC 51142]|uniref:Probable long-chain-fatty-acid CoA ligase n=1 Tax=Crocosphaera subtropica (strain ATCC 51142 / BH68) TaxID=43989 RepID=B1WUN2_CROS5|nr:long-chain fatty acid--CoA ligase [Crocosphaera subtropica]ACB50483.1 probable long-chain-fatty-acid CoA ligase [Crocosphaera subtropica ATCC 51142]